MAVWQANRQGIKNFSILVSHVLVPPAMASILQSPLNRVQGFLGPGHVCTVMGYREYEPIAERYKVPIVITGFEPIDILEGTLMTVRQLEAGKAEVENQYPRVVSRDGNRVAQDLVNQGLRSRATGSGAGSVRFRKAATSCATNFMSMTRSASSMCAKSTRRNRRFASAVWSCAG